MEYRMTTPLGREQLAKLRAGDRVLLTGDIYTARDAAHARFAQLLEEGKPLPLPLEGAAVYYAGPTPAPPGAVIGSIGPTTAGRMDSYTPALLRRGLAAMIGKGGRSDEVIETMKETGAVYFGFPGGAGALAAACVRQCEPIAFEDLGSEAVRRLRVEDFPLTVLIDSLGGSLYEQGPQRYLAECRTGAGAE